MRLKLREIVSLFWKNFLYSHNLVSLSYIVSLKANIQITIEVKRSGLLKKAAINWIDRLPLNRNRKKTMKPLKNCNVVQ